MAAPQTLSRPARPAGAGAPPCPPCPRAAPAARRPDRGQRRSSRRCALPLVFLLSRRRARARGGRPADLPPLTATLLWNTVRLTVVVTPVRGHRHRGGLVRRAHRPARPADLGGAAGGAAGHPRLRGQLRLGSLWTWVQGFRGAVLVMTLAVYPLVYLPVAASLRAADPGQEEVARSLGVGRLRTFVRVTLGQARGAILGGCLLVALVLLAEYGAFEILGYQTFTTEIFSEFSLSFSVPAACALSLVLVLLSLLVLGGEGHARGRGRVARSGPLARAGAAAAARPGHAARAGRLRAARRAGARRAGRLEHLLDVRGRLARHRRRCRWSAPRCTPPCTACCAAALATVAALPVALLAVRHPGRVRHLLERSTYLVLAMPGVVIAFALSYFTERYASGLLYQSAPLLSLLRDHVLPAGPGRGEGLGGPGPGQPRGGGALAGPAPARGAVAGDPAAGRARAWPPRSAWCSSPRSPSSPRP